MTEIKLPMEAVEKAIEAVRDAIGAVFAPAAIELGLLMGDEMKLWRFKNGIRILKRAEKIIENQGLTEDQLRRLTYGQQFILLEKATFEEENEIQEMWAQLIANALDPNQATKIEKRILDTLSALSPPEAGLLNIVRKIDQHPPLNTREDVAQFSNKIDEIANFSWRHYSGDIKRSCVQNLIRLRCIGIRPEPVGSNEVFAKMPRELIQQSGFSEWCLVDSKKFTQLLDTLIMNLQENAGIRDVNPNKHYRLGPPVSMFEDRAPLPAEFAYMLTPLGRELVDTCMANTEGSHDVGTE